jgi:hypothetical protein
VTDHPLSDRRVLLLQALGNADVVIDGDCFIAGSREARASL